MPKTGKAPANKGHSQIQTIRRFRAFWSSVSSVKFASDAIPEKTVKAIIAGVEGVE